MGNTPAALPTQPSLDEEGGLRLSQGISPRSSVRSLQEETSGSKLELDRRKLAHASRISMVQGQQAFTTLLSSWTSRKFAVGCAILFPIVFTVYFCWWLLAFFDAFFSPIYAKLFNFHVFGLGFVTSMAFIFCTGVFFSSWMGSALLNIGEWFVKRLPLVKHIYSASKQVSAALNPENEASKAFQECVLIRHPRQGVYAFGFITGRTTLQVPGNADVVLNTVYLPTNHVYVGDIFLMEDKDIVRTTLTVREGLEVVVSVGMAVPPALIVASQHR